MYTYITKIFVSTPKYKSDHCMLELEIKLPKYINIEKDDSKRQKPSLKWKRNNIELFKSQTESPSTMKLIKDIETYFSGNNNSITNDDILEKINFLYTYNSPKQKKHWDKKSKKHKKWYDVSCYEMNKKLKSIAKLNQKNPMNNDIRRNLNMVKKQYKKLLKDKKRKWSENIIRKIEKLQTEDPKQYWSLISELRNTPKNSNIIDKSKFEFFYEKLFSKYSNEHNDIHNAIIKEVEEILSGNKDIIDKDFTMKEFKESLSKLNNSKTAGPDRIPAEMIKNSPDNVLNLILALINRIKNTDQYPKLWALGYTTLIHKDGDDDDPDNYRAITICSAMAKIFALMVKCRLEEVVVKNNIIGDYQIGFKKGSRPADHLFLLKGITDHYSQKRKKVYACFIDYRKAYDNVWRGGLYYKLLKSGISPGIVKIIRSMNINTQQGLKINGTISNLFHSYRGVRQGCVLSPLLFNLFINDIPKIFDKSCRAVTLNKTELNCLMYADDIVLLSETEDGLRNCLEKLMVYNEKWHLKLNHKKTKTMIFQAKYKKKLNIILNGHPLEEVKQFKYLGNIITNTGNFKQNDNYLKLKGQRASYQIMKVIGKYMKPSKSLSLFEKIVEPILLYSCE